MEFIDLKSQYMRLKPDIDAALQSVLSGAQFIGGDEVKQLETTLAAYVGRKHCITCGNGTDALQLAYMAYGIRKGDAVFCPDMTFVASVEPAVMLGASPVFVDIEPDTYNISPSALEKSIEEIKSQGRLRPRAVVAVDFLGNPADYDAIERICRSNGLLLIEDAAQSMGASYKGKKCCSFGDIATTSFFPSKPLGCYGDGGAVFTDDDSICDLLLSLRVHGKGESKYDNIRIGINSRLDTMQAAILLCKQRVLDDEIAARQTLAERYHRALCKTVSTPSVTHDSISAYAQYAIMTKNKDDRDALAADLNAAGIPSLVYYPNPLHTMKAFSYDMDGHGFPNAERYASCNLGLPFSPYLSSRDQDRVISVVLSHYGAK